MRGQHIGRRNWQDSHRRDDNALHDAPLQRGSAVARLRPSHEGLYGGRVQFVVPRRGRRALADKAQVPRCVGGGVREARRGHTPHRARAPRSESDNHGRRIPAPLCRGAYKRGGHGLHAPLLQGRFPAVRHAARQSRFVVPRPLFYRHQVFGHVAARTASVAQGVAEGGISEGIFSPAWFPPKRCPSRHRRRGGFARATR